MQSVATLIFTTVVAIMAKRRGASAWKWGLLGALAFLVVDTIAALLLVIPFADDFSSDAQMIGVVAIEKIAVFAALIVLFKKKLSPAEVPEEQAVLGTPDTSSSSPVRDLATVDRSQLGLCPNCSERLLLADPKCSKCGAQFGAGSAWTVRALPPEA